MIVIYSWYTEQSNLCCFFGFWQTTEMLWEIRSQWWHWLSSVWCGETKNCLIYMLTYRKEILYVVELIVTSCVRSGSRLSSTVIKISHFGQIHLIYLKFQFYSQIKGCKISAINTWKSFWELIHSCKKYWFHNFLLSPPTC